MFPNIWTVIFVYFQNVCAFAGLVAFEHTFTLFSELHELLCSCLLLQNGMFVRFSLSVLQGHYCRRMLPGSYLISLIAPRTIMWLVFDWFVCNGSLVFRSYESVTHRKRSNMNCNIIMAAISLAVLSSTLLCIFWHVQMRFMQWDASLFFVNLLVILTLGIYWVQDVYQKRKNFELFLIQSVFKQLVFVIIHQGSFHCWDGRICHCSKSFYSALLMTLDDPILLYQTILLQLAWRNYGSLLWLFIMGGWIVSE